MPVSGAFRSFERNLDTNRLRFRGGAAKAMGRLALVGATIQSATTVAWQNPHNGPIVITRVFPHVTTAASGACTLDIGTTIVSAATSSDNLVDGLDVNAAAGMFDNLKNPGSNGKASQLLAEGGWITVTKASGNATALAGALLIEYMIP